MLFCHSFEDGLSVFPSCCLKRRSALRLHDAAQDLALPVGLVHRPALYSPAVCLHYARPAVVVDITLALLLSCFQVSADSPAVAAAPRNVVVIQNGNDARLG